ncbi:CorA family divalent cation transporter [Moheibacter lacus]|uniref:Magnesium transporter CorA n=1 Tax=Moheibacter lacus TaxID=2745851 RepID=A0A838ZLK4_9FLAO|nr:CorA family divalent cation transporter [Moheibacter lacus]MBA5628630.1 magnesium transporter CorA [Moheibacter lacus]
MENIFFQNNCFTWYNLENPEEKAVADYLQKFSLSTYTMQDALEAGHLPKFEHQDDFDFFLVRFYGKEKRSYSNIVREFSHKIGIFLGENFLITIHQKEVPFWDQIISEIKNGPNKENLVPRKLLYKILLKTIHTFHTPSVKISEQIEIYEQSLFTTERELKLNLKRLYELKRESSTCTKLLLLTRDVLNEFKPYIKNVASFKDAHEYNTKVLHLHSQNTDDLQNLFTLTISVSDQRANEIMKVLTVFSAFFLPLTFITGFYGMNFDFIPGLHSATSFYILFAMMIAIAVTIFIWFKRKKFL